MKWKKGGRKGTGRSGDKDECGLRNQAAKTALRSLCQHVQGPGTEGQ